MARHLPEALLFDMDGTLVESDQYWSEAEERVFDRYHVPWSQELAHTSIGVPLGVWVNRIFTDFGIMESAEAASSEIEAEVAEMFANRGPLWRPGAQQLMTLAKGLGIPSALVTATHSTIVDVIHSSAPAGALDVVVTGDMVRAGKPAPDGYLLAIEKLGVTAARSVAFEDSAYGVRAAQAAGAVTVWVPFMVDVPMTENLHVIDSLVDVTEDVLHNLVPSLA